MGQCCRCTTWDLPTSTRRWKRKGKIHFDLNVNDETSRYIFRIVALKEILSMPQAYGFYVDEDQKYQPIKKCKRSVCQFTGLKT